MPDTPSRYVELIRVSSVGQRDKDTPQDQRAALDRLRLSRPGTLVERIDSCTSGAKDSDDRADLTRLFKLAADKALDELRVRHVDRITRHPDARQRAAIFGALMDAGAKVVEASGREIDPADEMGELDLTLQGWFAARERKRILERTLAGKERKAREGRLVSGRPPAGRTWDKRTGTWGVDEKGAALVRRIFKLCLAGHSLSKIAADLNREGIPTFGGNEWTATHVSRILHDPAATGAYSSHGHTASIPPLVDKATFEAAGERLRNNNSLSGPPAKIPAMLRKLITCAICESPLYVDKGGRTRDPHHYYVCSSFNPDCAVYHNVAKVDAAVRERIKAWLERPDVLRAGTERPKDEVREAESEAEEARRELRDLDRQEERVGRLLMKGLTPKVNEKLLGEVVRNRAGAEQRLKAAQVRRDAAAHRDAMALELEAKIAELRAGIAKSTPKAWRKLCELLFPRSSSTWIRIHPDGGLELKGTISINDEGAATLARASGKPSGPSTSG